MPCKPIVFLLADPNKNMIPIIAGGTAAAVAVIGAVAGVAIYFKVKASAAVGSVPNAASYNSPSVPNQASYNDPAKNNFNNQQDNNKNRDNNRSSRGDRNTKDGPSNSRVKLPDNVRQAQLAPLQNPPQPPPANNGLWLGNNEPLPSISGQFPGANPNVPGMGSYSAPNVPGAADYSNPLQSLFGPYPGGTQGAPGMGSYTTPNIPGPASY